MTSSRRGVPGNPRADGAAAPAAEADRISGDERQAVALRSRLVMPSPGCLGAPREATNPRTLGAATAANVKELGYGG